MSFPRDGYFGISTECGKPLSRKEFSIRYYLLGAVVVAFSSAPVAAQDAPASDAVEETENAADEGDSIVVEGEIDEREIERCRIIRVTGTRFRERVCMTISEVDEQRANNRDVINDGRYEGAPITEVDENGFPVSPPT